MRKFLKKVGITSQREIEKAVNIAIDSRKIKGEELEIGKKELGIV